MMESKFYRRLEDAQERARSNLHSGYREGWVSVKVRLRHANLLVRHLEGPTELKPSPNVDLAHTYSDLQGSDHGTSKEVWSRPPQGRG